MSPLAEGFRRLASLGFRSWRSCLVIAAAVACTAPWALRDLRLETDSASLIGPGDPVSRVYRESLSRFGEANPLIVQILPGSTEPGVTDRFTDRLADRLRELPQVAAVEARPPAFDLMPWSIGMTRAALFNSEPIVLERFTERFEAEEMRKQLRRTRKRLLLSDPDLRKVLSSDVLDIGGIVGPSYEQRLGGLRFATGRGYFDAPDQGSRLLFVQPAGSAEDTGYCEDLVERVRRAIQEARAGTAGAELVAGRLTGKFAVVAQSAAVLRRDMLRISAIATGLVLALLLATFRGWRATAICSLPIVLSLPPVLWLARIVFSPLNFFAVGFIAIVMGLGVDAMLHCTARLYQYLGGEGSELEEAAGRALADCGPPVLIGTVTTAGAFLCLTVSDYRGLAEFGRLTAAALVLSFCTSMMLLPAVIRLVRPQRGTPGSGAGLLLLPPRFSLFGWNQPRTALLASATLVAVSLLIARGFGFDPEFKHLLPERLEALDVADDISRQFGSSFLLSSELLLEARDFDQGIEAQRRIEAELRPLIANGTVVGLQSPLLLRSRSTFAPEQERARKRAATLLSESRAVFPRSLSDLGFVASATHETYYDHLMRAVAAPVEFAAGTLPALQSDPRYRRFLAHDESGSWFRTLVWLPDGASGAEARRVVATTVSEFEAGSGSRLRLTGTHQVYEHLNELVGANFVRISGLSVVVVALLLLAFFRSAGDAMLGLVPIVAAVPVVLAAVVVSGIPFPPLGVGMMAIVLGIGIDDAVHLLSRPRSKGEAGLGQTLIEVGPIITLTSLTSAIGFGALAFASHRVLSSLGVVVAIGIVTCWLFSIGLLPACYRLLRRGGATVLLLLGTLAAGVGAGAPLLAQRPTVDEVLEKIERNYESVEAVTCQFSQRRKIPELSGEIEVAGELTFKVPNLLRISWQGDENLDLYADGETVWLVDHDLGEATRFEYSGNGVSGRLAALVPPFLFLPIADLRERFQIGVTEPEAALTRLEFKARRPDAEAPSSFVLDVDRRGRVRAVEVDLGGGERSRTLFRGWRRSAATSDDFFRYRPGAVAAAGPEPTVVPKP